MFDKIDLKIEDDVSCLPIFSINVFMFLNI